MNATLNNQWTTQAGEPVRFLLPTLPLALPMSFDQKCQLVGIKPWMIGFDAKFPTSAYTDQFREGTRNISTLDAFEKMSEAAAKAVEVFGRHAIIALLNPVVLERNQYERSFTLYDLFQKRREMLALWVANDAVAERKQKRADAAFRRSLKKSTRAIAA